MFTWWNKDMRDWYKSILNLQIFKMCKNKCLFILSVHWPWCDQVWLNVKWLGQPIRSQNLQKMTNEKSENIWQSPDEKKGSLRILWLHNTNNCHPSDIPKTSKVSTFLTDSFLHEHIHYRRFRILITVHTVNDMSKNWEFRNGDLYYRILRKRAHLFIFYPKLQKNMRQVHEV